MKKPGSQWDSNPNRGNPRSVAQPLEPQPTCKLGGGGEWTDPGDGIPPDDIPGEFGDVVLIIGGELNPP